MAGKERQSMVAQPMGPSCVKVKVPATSANLGPGFDVLGIALSLYEQYEYSLSPERSLLITGLNAEKLSCARDNLVFKTADMLSKTVGKKMTFSCEAIRSIPMGVGLGSSSAAIVATLTGLNALFSIGLTKVELLDLAARIEGHPDNVAPALLGGLTISYLQGKTAQAYRLGPAKSIRALVLVPAFALETKKARGILKDTVRRKDAVFNISRSAILTHLLIQNGAETRKQLFRDSIDDRLHQAARSKIIPGYLEAKAALESAGVLGACLSGAGPSVIGFTVDAEKDACLKALKRELKKRALSFMIFDLGLDRRGCQVSQVSRNARSNKAVKSVKGGQE